MFSVPAATQNASVPFIDSIAQQNARTLISKVFSTPVKPCVVCIYYLYFVAALGTCSTSELHLQLADGFLKL